MKKLLITGGAGFIGGNFVHYMLNKYPDYVVYNLDLLTYAGELAKHRNIEKLKRYNFIQGDISNRGFIQQLFTKERFDYVVHFAAESHVDRSIVDPDVFVKTNVLGTQTLLAAAYDHNVTKFVHVSTDEVYGELELNTTTLFTEETPLAPNSPYSASKASSDLLVRSYFSTYGFPINITRCSNNYGPYHFPEKLIPLTIAHVMENKKIPVYGDGQNVRDWLHVKDHCSALDLVMHNGEAGEVYNVGGRNERTNIEVVQTIIKQLGASEDLIEYVTDRLGHDRRYAIDPTKLEGLGWQPKYNFDNGIYHTIKWYQDNVDWWQPLVGAK